MPTTGAVETAIGRWVGGAIKRESYGCPTMGWELLESHVSSQTSPH